MKRILVALLWCAAVSNSFAQKSKSDSLLATLKKTGEDTNRVKVLMALAYDARATNPGQMAAYASEALVLSSKLKWQEGEGRSAYLIGSSCYLRADYQNALAWYDKALKILEDTNDKALRARIISNIGIVYEEQGNYPKALENYYRGLALVEQLGDKKETATTVGNIGAAYWNLGENSKALENYHRALKLLEGTGDKEGMARNYSNIGLVQESEGKFGDALASYEKALAETEGTSFLAVRSNALGNIGNVYRAQADTAKDHFLKGKLVKTALQYSLEALKIKEQLENQLEIAIGNSNVADIYLTAGNTAEARKWFEKSLALSTEIGDLEGIKSDHYLLSELYTKENKFEEAFSHYKKFVAARDSLYNEENTKKQTKLEMQYEFNRKELQAKADQDRKDALALTEKKRQNIILLSVSCLGLLVFGFALFAYRSYLQKKKANEDIQQQKTIIEEKQKEILDSIYYARRIQSSLMPHEKQVHKQLNRLIKNN